jgi:LacI family transcriptional regulator
MLAEKSGLSVSTISHALGKDAHLFSAETRQKVEELARQMGYKPNAVARAMRSGKSGNLALLLNFDLGVSFLPQELLYGIEETVAAENLQLSLAQLPDAERERRGKLPKVLRELMADGLLINITHDLTSNLLDIIEKQNSPAIWINRRLGENAVFADDFGASRRLTEYFIGLGHRSIAYVGLNLTNHYSVWDRINGYKAAMREAGLAPRIVHLDSDNFDEAAALLKAEHPPTALVTYSQPTAVRILHYAIAYLRLRVPQDLSVATFDLSTANNLGLQVGAMLLPEYEIGCQAVRMLLARIRRPELSCPGRAVKMEFDPGETCAPPQG